MTIDKTTFKLAQDGYFHPGHTFGGAVGATEVYTKDMIVLHFTAGSTARSAYDTWQSRAPGTKHDEVATPYIVDRSGKVFETFDPKYWAYHLGCEPNPGHIHHKRSIGIEIVNVGPLRPSLAAGSQTLNWWPNGWKQPYCQRSEVGMYIAKNYRGENYFATYMPEQVAAVRDLVKSLCAQFGIPLETPPVEIRDMCLPGFVNYKGICSHQNWRRDKSDIGPAWPWDFLK